MRYLKTYKLYNEKIDIGNIDQSELDEIFNSLKDDKTIISEILEDCEDILANVSDIVETKIKYDDLDNSISLEINGDAFESKGEYADSDDDIEFILGDTEVSDIKQVINLIKTDGYDKIRLCISMDDEENFDDFNNIITVDEAKIKLDEIKNKPIDCIQILFSK